MTIIVPIARRLGFSTHCVPGASGVGSQSRLTMYYGDSLKSSEVPSQSTAWLRPYRVRIFKVAGLTRDRFCLFWQASRRYSKSHWRMIPIHGTSSLSETILGRSLAASNGWLPKMIRFVIPMDASVGGDDRPSALSSKCAADERSVIRCVAEVLRKWASIFCPPLAPVHCGMGNCRLS
jgi:hypothetical protein